MKEAAAMDWKTKSLAAETEKTLSSMGRIGGEGERGAAVF